MCGRFSLAVAGEDLREEFGLAEAPFDLHPRYNVAPTQTVPVLLRGENGAMCVAAFRWGLVPAWARNDALGSRLINARGETLAQKPAFRAAFRQRRCLVPADGWYEWRKDGPRKQPMWIHLRSRRPFALAGLWERWRAAPQGEWLHTFTIVTTDAAASLRSIHDRMPLLLPRQARDRWLDPGAEPAELAALVRPYAGDDLETWAVSPLVNSPRHDGPECVAELERGHDAGPNGQAWMHT